MKDNITNLINKFEEIKRKDWVKSINKNSSGVGMTLESLLNIQENNLPIPDFNNIEIKAKKEYTKGFITLFNCTPTGPFIKETERLKDEFGYPHNELKQYKVLNNSIYVNKITKIGNNYYFKLKIDNKNEMIILQVYNKNMKLIEEKTYWSYDLLKEKLIIKTKYLAIFTAETKILNNEIYFKYKKIEIYRLKDFSNFINLLEDGIIRITFKISIFKTGKRKGQIHDHGTGFDINKKDFIKLYDLIKEK